MPIKIEDLISSEELSKISPFLEIFLTPEAVEKLKHAVQDYLEEFADKVTGRRDELIINLYGEIERLKEENEQLRAQLAEANDDEPSVPPGDSGDDNSDGGDNEPVNPPLSDAEYPAPMYSPGKVVIPAEFLKHGAFRELRFEKCSLANGLLKKVDDVTYTLPGPEHEVWRWTDGQIGKDRKKPCIGTVAKFADGSQFNGYVDNYKGPDPNRPGTGSYPMPIIKIGQSSKAFWVRMA